MGESISLRQRQNENIYFKSFHGHQNVIALAFCTHYCFLIHVLRTRGQIFSFFKMRKSLQLSIARIALIATIEGDTQSPSFSCTFPKNVAYANVETPACPVAVVNWAESVGPAFVTSFQNLSCCSYLAN